MNSTTASTVPSAPEGFVLVMDPFHPDVSEEYWQGPYEDGDAWRIETTFTFEEGVAFELDVDYSRAGLTASQAIAAGTALARLAAKYA